MPRFDDDGIGLGSRALAPWRQPGARVTGVFFVVMVAAGGDVDHGPRRRPGAVGAGADGVHARRSTSSSCRSACRGRSMTLIANYRAIKHDDARRAAAGAALVEVHGGHVRRRRGHRHRAHRSSSGCCGRSSWASGATAFGIPFAFEGLFFFTEAIFIAIYIFGWRRLKPWAALLDRGARSSIAGIVGSVSVVAANAWMNAPAGLHAGLAPARSSTSTRWG